MLPKDPIKAEEYRKKMSEISSRQKTDEWRKNRKKWAKSYYSSKENREKMKREYHPLSEAGLNTLREKAIERNHKRFASKEARDKQRDATKKQWNDPETRQKMISGLKKARRRLTGKSSKGEKEMVDFIRSIYSGEVRENDRTFLDGFELDAYIPELELAFEFNGEYWHSLPRMIERDAWKRRECRKKKIALLNVWEDDWNKNSEEVKLFIKSLLNPTNQL